MVTTPSMLPEVPDLDRGEAERRRHAENKGRLAMVGVHVSSTGVGIHEIANRVEFGMTFIRKPYMAHGAELDPDDVRDLFDTADSDDPPSVQVSGFVTEWDKTTKGMYVGAWVAVSVFVDTSSLLAPPADFAAKLSALSIEHHFSFHEIALKTFVPNGQKGAEPSDDA